MYFNKKYERVGSLFQGRFKAVHINQEAHFIHLPFYIHTNPLSLNYGGSTSIDFLENYRWSSYLDDIGKKNFPSVTSRECKKATEKWIQERKKNTEKIEDAMLED